MQCFIKASRRCYSQLKPLPRVDVPKIESTLHIHKLEDWYNIPKVHLTYADKHALKQYKNVEQLVRDAYPAHAWEHEKFFQQQVNQKATLTPQNFMTRILRSIFGSTVKIDTNVRASLGLLGSAGFPLEIDVYLPELKLGFEYQDEHHYFHNVYGSTTLEEYQERDRMKLQKAAESGITIIEVPFWWDWNVESLVATIKQRRSDLLTNTIVKEGVELILQTPPPTVISKFNYEIPDLGIPMLAMYSPQSRLFDPTGWWIFEKFDGIRAVWHPALRVLYSRWAKPLRFPNWFVDSLPTCLWLDGEIWFGRDRGARYQAIKSAVAISLHITNWEKMKYIIFDAPQPGLRATATYEERYNVLKQQIPTPHPFVTLVDYEVCTGKDSVEQKFLEIRAREGEGVVIRDPYAFYINGYSRFLYKHKGYNDAEAMILKKLSDERYLCRVHKQHIKHNLDPGSKVDAPVDDPTESSKIFYDIEMILDDQLYEGDLKDIKEGGFVSFRYTGTTFGPPVNPKIYAVRSDVHDWEQIVGSKRQPPAHQKIWKPVIHTNDWTVEANRRAFFDKFALARGFDPLVADNWYSIDSVTIRSQAGRLLQYYNDSHITAILQLYPDIGLQQEKFISPPAKYWNSQANQTKFFNSIAKSHSFDPLVAANWYQFPASDIRKFKGGKRVLHRHGESLHSALSAAYPFTDFEKSDFNAPVRFSIKGNRESFLRQFATTRGFDPLVPDNWYNVTIGDLATTKAGATVLSYYNTSVYRAVADSFPDIGFQRHLFTNLPNSFWADMKQQRVFLDNFAKSHGNFDPLQPANWSPFSAGDIVGDKYGKLVLNCYSGKLGPALTSVYGFDPPLVSASDNVVVLKRKKWSTRAARKQFFDELAEKRNFDPLIASNWYSINHSDMKGGQTILNYYNNLQEAVIDAYPNIGLDPSKFIKQHPRDYWLSMDNRKRHFDEYAKSLAFDPLIAENWYHLTSFEIRKFKWGRSLLEYYNSSAPRALIDIYKDIGLDITKFKTASRFRSG